MAQAYPRSKLRKEAVLYLSPLGPSSKKLGATKGKGKLPLARLLSGKVPSSKLEVWVKVPVQSSKLSVQSSVASSASKVLSSF